MVNQEVRAACGSDKVGSLWSRPRRGAGVAVRWGAGFTEESVGRRPPCYRLSSAEKPEQLFRLLSLWSDIYEKPRHLFHCICTIFWHQVQYWYLKRSWKMRLNCSHWKSKKIQSLYIINTDINPSCMRIYVCFTWYQQIFRWPQDPPHTVQSYWHL